MIAYIRNVVIKKYMLRELKIKEKPLWSHILFPLMLTFLAVAVKVYFFSEVPQKAPYLFFFAIIFLSACFGGFRSTLSASIITVSSAIILFFTPPELSTTFKNVNIIQMGVFFLEASMVSMLVYIIEETQRKLRTSENKFRGIVEKTEEGFFMLDQNIDIIYTSPSVFNVLGFGSDDLKLESFYALIHPQDVESLKLSVMKLVAQTSLDHKFQYRLLKKDESWIWAEITISNLLKDPGISALVIHFNNITERVIREKQQEDFVNIATHELKSPVTVLKGYLQLLTARLKKQNGQEEHLKMLDKMNMQLDKLLTLIADMLDSTRISAGELNHHFNLMNMNSCVTECVEAIKASYPTHHIACHLTSDLSELQGDKDRIGQVITNFIINAIKYSPGKNEIMVSTAIADDFFVVKIKDNGIGIPKDKQKQIFDRFYRVDTLPEGVFQGLGLGLFIASEIIKKHKGYIGVSSEEGKGSQFWFKLPIIKTESLNQN